MAGAHAEPQRRDRIFAAPLQRDAEGRVAWDQMWQGFCELALAGGPLPSRWTVGAVLVLSAPAAGRGPSTTVPHDVPGQSTA